MPRPKAGGKSKSCRERGKAAATAKKQLHKDAHELDDQQQQADAQQVPISAILDVLRESAAVKRKIKVVEGQRSSLKRNQPDKKVVKMGQMVAGLSQAGKGVRALVAEEAQTSKPGPKPQVEGAQSGCARQQHADVCGSASACVRMRTARCGFLPEDVWDLHR